MSFTSDLAKFARKANISMEKAYRGVVLSILKGVINDTPVLTGRLRANWQTTTGKEATSSILQLDRTGSIAFAGAEANLGKLGVTSFFTNNLPYAHRIEFDGYSNQAPSGMLRKNLLRVGRILKKEARKIR